MVCAGVLGGIVHKITLLVFATRDETEAPHQRTTRENFILILMQNLVIDFLNSSHEDHFLVAIPSMTVMRDIAIAS